MQIAPGRCWRACCEIRPGETLVVVRLDRLARSVSHALAVIEQHCDNSTDEKAQLAQGRRGNLLQSGAGASLRAIRPARAFSIAVGVRRPAASSRPG